MLTYVSLLSTVTPGVTVQTRASMSNGTFPLRSPWTKTNSFSLVTVFPISEQVTSSAARALVSSILNKARKTSSNIIEKFDFNALGDVLDLETSGFILYLISDNLHCFGTDSWLSWLPRTFCLEYRIQVLGNNPLIRLYKMYRS